MEELKKGDQETSPDIRNRKRKKFAFIILGSLLIIGALIIFFYLRYKATHITTDDAFIEGTIYTIASKVSGTIKDVYVKDNQFVRENEILLEIDPVDYDVKVQEVLSRLNAEKSKLFEIEAKIETLKKQLLELRRNIEVAKANLELQEANLKQAETDFKRAENLFKKEAISKERFEKATTDYQVAVAKAKATSEQLQHAKLFLETQNAVIKQAEASKVSQLSIIKQNEALLKAAELNYGYTKVHSPSDGYVTKKSVEKGNQIHAGQPLMAIVPLNDIWIVANYKETQLEKVRPGQKVKIKVDTYPGKTFKGKVESIMAGTGAVFSLFPPENATGSYVKVVQRIPVKILLDEDTDPEHVLRIGMSVVPTIIVRDE
ncbi:MAG: HlyD family secretion protein [Nitrospirae bacterium]|nr:HlyD family secretion protein [Nitrospirota bacterium]